MAVLSFSSCNKEEEEIVEEARPFIGDRSLLVNTIFKNGGAWDEVEYLINDPSQYEIHRYFVGAGYNPYDYLPPNVPEDRYTRCEYCDLLYKSTIKSQVYRDSVFIGQFEYNWYHQVYFKDANSGDSILLYDFDPIIMKNSGNYVHRIRRNMEYFIPPTFTIKENGYKNTGSSDWRWDYDEFGGKTIVSIGSTAGVFTPIIGSPKSGYAREILQAYRFTLKVPYPIRKYDPDYRHDQPELLEGLCRIADLYFIGTLYYFNPDSPVAPYLPDDIWVQPVAIEYYNKYKEYLGM